MRFRHPDGSTVHLAYCTNVHPSDDPDTLLAQVRDNSRGVRSRLGVDRLGLGLWLPAPVASRLARGGEAQALRSELDQLGLEVVSLNAFPYENFHARRVKKDVYSLDWSEPQRLQYTLDCAQVLATLLPDDVERGSISTLPLAWRDTWTPEHWHSATKHLGELATGLEKIEAQTGRAIQVGLEPEPGCQIETTSQLVAAFDPTQWLSVAAFAPVGQENRLGACVDTCHLAVAFEDPAMAMTALGTAGIPIVKTQVSAALEVDQPAQQPAREALAGYAEDRYLHQVREYGPGGMTGRDDLPEALAGADALSGTDPWRVHFHVPLHEQPDPPLASTTEHLRNSLEVLVGGPHPMTDHLEVETYTWSVLPLAHRPADATTLVDGLAAELTWVADHLMTLGLEQL